MFHQPQGARLPHLHLALKILFDQQGRAFARAQAVGINLDAVKLAQARSREPVEKSGSQNCLERVAGHERKSEHARPRSSDGLKFFDALTKRILFLQHHSHCTSTQLLPPPQQSFLWGTMWLPYIRLIL